MNKNQSHILGKGSHIPLSGLSGNELNIIFFNAGFGFVIILGEDRGDGIIGFANVEDYEGEKVIEKDEVCYQG
jgi:hypothetical protein